MRPGYAVILATSVSDGEAYAAALGLADYRIGTAWAAARLEGLHTRAVVVTPRFATALSAGDVRAWHLFHVAERNAMHSGAPRG